MPGTPVAPAFTSDARRDRAVGALLGLALGDALGTTLEFTARDSRTPLTDLVGGGPFRLRAGEWTDDTAMALALGESLLAHAGLDEADLMGRFVRWWREGAYSCTGHCFDIGMTTRSALARFEATGDPIAGSTGPRSAGNGSLMRLAPVAIRFWHDPEARRDAAARQSRTTHGAAEAVDACIAMAEMLAEAIAGASRDEVLRDRPGPWAGAVAAVLSGRWRDRPREAIASSGYVVHSLEAALWCVGRHGDFAGAVLAAANLGDDADTTAAITGQLAGALAGASALPPAWLGRLAWRDRLESLASDLFAASLVH